MDHTKEGFVAGLWFFDCGVECNTPSDNNLPNVSYDKSRGSPFVDGSVLGEWFFDPTELREIKLKISLKGPVVGIIGGSGSGGPDRY